MKSQTKIEFLLTSFIFVIFIIISSNFFSDNMARIIYDIKSERIKLEAENIMETLVYEKGFPENWYVNPNPSSIYRLGLASGMPYNLSIQKINALQNNCDLLRKIFTIPSYRVVIIDENGNILLECGIKSRKGAHLERPVVISSNSGSVNGKIILDIWW